MKKILLISAVPILLIAGAVVILPGLVPDDVYKTRISEQVSKSLGRDITIEGDVKVSAFPRISAAVSGVTIANPDGFNGAPFAKMDALSAKVKLWPLLSKRVEIDSFELNSPQINLIKTKGGATNWSLGNAQTDPKPDAEGFSRNRPAGSLNASIGIFKITNGVVNYTDASAGQSHKAENVNLTLAVPAMNASASVKGNLILDGLALSLSGKIDTPETFLSGQETPFTIDINSDAGDVKANGRFEASDAIALRATLDATIPDTAKLVALAGRDIPYADLAKSAAVKGDITYAPAGIVLTNADIALKGALFDGNYKGSFSTLSGANMDGLINAKVKDLPALLKAIDQDIAQAALVNTADLRAKIGGTPDAMIVSDVDLNLAGDALTAGYTGSLTLKGTPTLNGSFTADVTDTQAVTQAIDLNIAALKAAQTLKVSGDISGPATAPTVSDITAKAGGDNIDIDFTGAFTGGKIPALKGEFTADVKSVETLAQTAQIDLPYANIIGGLKASGNLDGPVSNLIVADLDAALSGGLLTAKFGDGSVTLGEKIAVSGTMEIAAVSVRSLAEATGSSLPAGDIFEAFSLSGNVGGTADNMRFDNAALSFDDIRGGGAFAMDMTGSKPMLTGNLDITSGLDLAPYAAKSTKQNKTGGLKPWSEQPLDLSPLRAVNADLELSTPFVKTDRLELGQSKIKAIVKNGKLTAKVPGAQLYSGTGDITLVLDGSGSVPAASMDVALNSLSAPSFLGAAAGFDKVTGTTSTTLSVSGQGATQAALMKSLNGSGDFKLSEGALKGIDLGALLGGIETAWTNRSLPAGIGPGQSTQFRDLLSGFNIQGGVVTVKDFTLSGQGISAEGGGTLDVGNQKVDFSLRPRLLDENGRPKGNGLAGFGIPVRLAGNFNSVKAGLDTDLLKDIVAARAKAKAADEIKDRVGGPLGNILGGVLGGGTQPNPAPAPAPETPPEAAGTENAPVDPAPKEKSDEEKALDLIGGLFGKKN